MMVRLDQVFFRNRLEKRGDGLAWGIGGVERHVRSHRRVATFDQGCD